jgi:small GTP-binding protein
MLKYKIILAGDKDVGKTSLITRFCDNTFKEDMKATIGVDFKRKKIDLKINGREIPIELHVWDFGGEKRYRKLFPSYANGASGALILFDTTRKETLLGIEEWVEIVEKNANDNVVKLLIATKVDLKDKREVTKEEGTNFSAKFTWFGDIIKTSSKTGENVEEAFLTLASEMMKSNFHLCKSCGDIFDIKLRYCVHCGEKIEE